ncbi:MAG TPA: sulfotransferase [Jatrophihabitans sp.]|nr:sulfotransferase [Jatrophihabitans sp.]
MSVSASNRADRRPILVTGMPRSGTTWLARLLASAPGTALGGREPMNPRGRQYALAHTLPGWVELTAPTSRQRRALRSAYHGYNPLVFSRYGRRQWAAPLPWTRLVVKDPFAMLSVPAVREVTGACAVLLYRHPGAALASYRRMGWSPDVAELQPVLRDHRRRLGIASGAPLVAVDERGEAEAMGRFWAALYEMALDNVADLEDVVVVSHEEIASGGPTAGRRLFGALGLRWSSAAEAELAGARADSAPADAPADDRNLHNLDRAPGEVAAAWRKHVSPDEVAVIEAVTAEVRGRLDAERLALVAP